MKIIQFFLSLFFFIVVGIILILGYLGFIPFLSDFMGTGQTRNLGIKYNQQEYQTFINKAQTEIIELKKTVSPDESIIYDGKKDLNESFSQEEISARLNYSKWKYMPVNNVQVRINNNGVIEFSANLLVNRLPGFIARESMGKYTLINIAKGFAFINQLKTNPPIYIKFTASLSNNILNINVQKIEIGKFNLPLARFGTDQIVTIVFNNVVSKISGFYGKTVIFSKGQMIFQGTVPEKELVEVAF